MPDADSHYFDADPSVASAPQRVELWLPDTQLVLTTDRGVFGHDRIDAGTKLLLLRAPAPAATGALLDLGCGAGAIALTMARRAPGATVWAIDVNARARALCADNARANGLANVRIASPDEVPGELRFATIWSNPPIRIGKPALHELLARWLTRLAPSGEAVLVVHKHLGADSLQRWLATELGLETTRSSSSSGYRILHVAHA
jgi:16S rRNA (guanine1207-N2)-methyltransferase